MFEKGLSWVLFHLIDYQLRIIYMKRNIYCRENKYFFSCK